MHCETVRFQTQRAWKKISIMDRIWTPNAGPGEKKNFRRVISIWKLGLLAMSVGQEGSAQKTPVKKRANLKRREFGVENISCARAHQLCGIS